MPADPDRARVARQLQREPAMSLSEIIILSVIVAMFTTFIVAVGGTILYLTVSEMRAMKARSDRHLDEDVVHEAIVPAVKYG